MRKVTFDIDEDEILRIEEIAEKEDRSVGSVLRLAVKEYK